MLSIIDKKALVCAAGKDLGRACALALVGKKRCISSSTLAIFFDETQRPAIGFDCI
jgi:hypothetical protein